MKGNLQIGNELSAQTRSVIERLIELSDTGEGNRGDPLNRYLKVGDLIDLGLAKALSRTAQTLVSGKNLVPSGGSISTIPPKPTGLYTSDGFAHVFLGWDSPLDAYSNHAYTEVFRSTEDNRASAVPIAQVSIASIWADMDVTYGTTYFYWIRFVSESNITGPFNSSVGTSGQAVQDPEELLERLRDKITATELYNELLDRIDLIDAEGTGLVDRVEDLYTNFGTSASAAQAASDAIAAKTAALIAQGHAEAAQAGAESAEIASTAQANAAATSATNASSFSTTSSNAATASSAAKVAAEAARDNAINAANASASSASVASSEASNAGDSASAAQTSETNAATSAGSASTSAANASTSETNAAGSASSASTSATNAANSATSSGNSASAASISESNASASADSASASASSANASSTTAATQAGNALTYANQASSSAADAANHAIVSASDYTAVNARLNDFGGSGVTVEQKLTATADSIEGITGSYKLKIDVNGTVAGFGLSVEDVNGEPESNFIVNADNFALVSSSKRLIVLNQSVVGTDLLITLDSFYALDDGDQVKFSWVDNEDWIGFPLTIHSATPNQFKVPIGGRSTPLISTPKGNNKTLSSLTRSGTVGTATFQNAHGLLVGGTISISRVKAHWNGDYVVTSVSGLSVTFDVPTYFPVTAESELRAHKVSMPFIANGENVVMDGAFIKDATITNAAIQDLNVAKVTGLDANFIEANISDGSITNAKIGNEIRSSIYNSSQGWLLNKDGNAIFSNAYVRGDVQASSVTADAIYTNDVIQSTNFVTGVSGWKIERTGAAEFNDVVLSRPNILASGEWINPSTSNYQFSHDSYIDPIYSYDFDDNKWFISGVNEGWGPLEFTVLVDTGYDNFHSVFDTKGRSFTSRVAVVDTYYNVTSDPGNVRLASIPVSSEIIYEIDHWPSATPGPGGGRVFLNIKVKTPRNIHPNVHDIRIKKIKWSLSGVS